MVAVAALPDVLLEIAPTPFTSDAVSPTVPARPLKVFTMEGRPVHKADPDALMPVE